MSMACENCGKQTRRVVPVLNPAKQVVAWNPQTAHRVLPRSALETLGYEIPWGEHPDDDRFQTWCEDCAADLTAGVGGNRK